MRNVTPLAVLLPRLRNSLFDKEVLSQGVYPTNLSYKDGTLLLRYTFFQLPGRAPYRAYCLLMRGKARHYVELNYADGTEEAISEAHFVNRILDGSILDRMELVEEPYTMTATEVEKAVNELYDW